MSGVDERLAPLPSPDLASDESLDGIITPHTTFPPSPLPYMCIQDRQTDRNGAKLYASGAFLMGNILARTTDHETWMRIGGERRLRLRKECGERYYHLSGWGLDPTQVNGESVQPLAIVSVRKGVRCWRSGRWVLSLFVSMQWW